MASVMYTDDEVKWQSQASCRDIPADDIDILFFPDSIDERKWQRAKISPRVEMICRMCPVFDECLNFAIKHKMSGIWAATTDYTRAKMVKDEPKAICPGCASTVIMPGAYNRHVCCACGLSWI